MSFVWKKIKSDRFENNPQSILLALGAGNALNRSETWIPERSLIGSGRYDQAHSSLKALHSKASTANGKDWVSASYQHRSNAR